MCSRSSSRLYVLFLYGPTITIVVLSFQGPEGGLTFPMNGVSLHWFAKSVGQGTGIVYLGDALFAARCSSASS